MAERRDEFWFEHGAQTKTQRWIQQRPQLLRKW